jgi:tetraacyldisaccharide 4'-kinase
MYWVRKIKSEILLTPLSWLYGGITALRNFLFDRNILPSENFPLPIICVGNITVGGTGKTPAVEYLIDLLEDKYHLATLSRGYKRRKGGFLLVTPEHTAADVGDEPCQLKHKYPFLTVAVDANRRRGLRNLFAPMNDEATLWTDTDKRPQVIILDDAMQHRYVTPSLTVMLTSYNNLYYRDKMLPAGNLREAASNDKRADIVVVTKCGDLSPDEAQRIEAETGRTINQSLFFSDIQYLDLQPLYTSLVKQNSMNFTSLIDKDVDIVLITGIANPQPLIDKLNTASSRVHLFSFPDHHSFTKKDIEYIDLKFRTLSDKKRLLITTEKDAMRLKMLDYLPNTWKPVMYYAPIRMKFLFGSAERFNFRILNHILSK